ncbi:hypothetical protein CEXT_51041 [Caerostris extrusa]|uniref:Uncharacterized protein n=1 Tax=Caerostris extrusa TaxID=172846 RepID=A0AAV4MXH1_CAEEX|nr:hypothetical protein CEXT_51041 [Caerostris extrusa]
MKFTVLNAFGLVGLLYSDGEELNYQIMNVTSPTRIQGRLAATPAEDDLTGSAKSICFSVKCCAWNGGSSEVSGVLACIERDKAFSHLGLRKMCNPFIEGHIRCIKHSVASYSTLRPFREYN